MKRIVLTLTCLAAVINFEAGAAENPAPGDGVGDVEVETTLTWDAMPGAISQTVYIGIDWTAVENETSASYTPAGPSLAVSLNLDRTYYWKVVENDGSNEYVGPIWSFQTVGYIVLDDFDQYTSATDLALHDPAWTKNPVEAPTVLYLDTVRAKDGNCLHISGRSQYLPYTVTGRCTYASGQDWTAHGITTLSLWVRGLAGTYNPAEPIFVNVEDSSGNIGGYVFTDTSIMQQDLYVELNVPLNNLTVVTGGLPNLAAVKVIHVGFGDGLDGGGGFGDLYVDDIRLESVFPEIELSADSVDFIATIGGTNPDANSVTIRNSSLGTLNWSATWDAQWLSVTPASGASTGEEDTADIAVDISGLGAGYYTDEIFVTDPCASNSPQSITVGLAIELAEIELSKSSVAFYAQCGGSNPANDSFSIRNSAAGTLNWDLTWGSAWLSATPWSGTSAGEYDPVSIAVDISGLDLGYYSDEIVVTDPWAGNSPQSLAVSLTVGEYADDGDGVLQVPSEFPNIEMAMDAATTGEIVVVADGVWTGPGNVDLNFRGKAITVKSLNGPSNCSIDCQGSEAEPHRGFILESEEGSDSVIDGFTIIGGYSNDGMGGGILSTFSGPTISHCIFWGNYAEVYGGGVGGDRPQDAHIVNCTFWANVAGDGGGAAFSGCGTDGGGTVRNCIFQDNYPDTDGGVYSLSYGKCGFLPSHLEYNILESTWSTNGMQQTGTIIGYPLFADEGGRDFHVKSEAGRWDANSSSWVVDTVTSPAIDTGDTNMDWGEEFWPHGKRINMGAYGGTKEASWSLSDVGSVADLDNNEFVNWADWALFSDQWYSDGKLLRENLNRKDDVNEVDFSIFAGEWLFGEALDVNAPTPNPLTWAEPPTAVKSNMISMTAATATDPHGVEYYFECTAGGGHDSSWHGSASYTDTGLWPLTEYTYRVKARDLSVGLNETGWSGEASCVTPEGPDPNIAGWWELEDGSGSVAVEWVGGNDGAISGANWATGHVGAWCLEFDGNSDYVVVNDNDSLDFGTGEDFSISLWFKIGSHSPTDGPNLLNKREAGGDYQGYMVFYEDRSDQAAYRKVGAVFDFGSSGVAVLSDSYVDDGAWHHIVAMRAGTTLRLYLDGTQEGGDITGSGYDADLSNGNSLIVGMNMTLEYKDYYGWLDEIMIWRKALTAQEVDDLYQYGLNN